MLMQIEHTAAFYFLHQRLEIFFLIFRLFFCREKVGFLVDTFTHPGKTLNQSVIFGICWLTHKSECGQELVQIFYRPKYSSGDR